MGKIDYAKVLFGKTPPSSLELEELVLGAMLNNPHNVIIVKEVLNIEDFYNPNNKIICSAIFEVSEQTLVDIPLVVQTILSWGKIEQIPPYELVKISAKSTSDANLKNYCFIIKQKSISRKLIEISGNILTRSYSEQEDVFDVLDEADYGLRKITNELSEIKVTPISNIAMNIIERFDTKVYNARNGIENPNEIYTHIPEWDAINGSLFNGLYVVAGRPAMGKGVHLTELACRMGKYYDIGIINGEMSNEQLLTRIGCNLMNIDNFLWKKNPATVTDGEQELVKLAMNEALQLKLHIDKNRDIHKIANKIKLWVHKYNVKCVLADFLTIFKVSEDISRHMTETQKVNYVLDVFVTLCEELKIPIILYVQMNREILGRGGVKEPNMGDLKQSGSIEELAFQVSFLHRPEYYDPNNIVDEFGESTKDLMYQIIAKHRDGEVGRMKHKAILKCSQLKDWNNTVVNGWKPAKDNPF